MNLISYKFPDNFQKSFVNTVTSKVIKRHSVYRNFIAITGGIDYDNFCALWDVYFSSTLQKGYYINIAKVRIRYINAFGNHPKPKPMYRIVVYEMSGKIAYMSKVSSNLILCFMNLVVSGKPYWDEIKKNASFL